MLILFIFSSCVRRYFLQCSPTLAGEYETLVLTHCLLLLLLLITLHRTLRLPYKQMRHDLVILNTDVIFIIDGVFVYTECGGSEKKTNSTIHRGAIVSAQKVQFLDGYFLRILAPSSCPLVSIYNIPP